MIRWVALTFLLVLSACSEPALHGTTARPLKKVDILWVFDHSPGSCRVEQTLARDFHALTDTLAARGVTDVRFAAIADQQIADKAAYDPVQAAGQLQHSAERHTLPTCQVSRQVPCFPQVDAQVLAACDATQEVCLKTCANEVLCDELCVQPHTACVQDANRAAADAACDGPGEVTMTAAFPSSLCPANGVLKWPGPPAGTKWTCIQDSLHAFADQNCFVGWGCSSRCSTDQECRDAFEADVPPYQQRMICLDPFGRGCAFPPTTEDCPPDDQLPDVLDAEHLGLAHCLLQMQLSNSAMSSFEGGLRSAWAALDPQGPNCPRDAKGKPLPTCQNQRFLRDDALLLIVFAGDEDDCSVDPSISLDASTPEKAAALLGTSGAGGLLPAADRNECQYLGDADGGDPDMQEGYCQLKKRKDPKVRCRDDCAALPKDSTETQPCLDANAKLARTDKRFGSVSTFYDKFRSLKTDPAQVMFASIAGDSPLVTHQPGELPFSAAVHADRVAFYGSNGLICSTATSKGEFGSRYVKLAQQFGTHGYVINWCSDSYAGGLSGLAERVADVMAGKVK